MSNTNQLLIEKYIEGKLSAEEQTKFELRLVSDAAFAKEVNEAKDLLIAIRAFGRSGLKKELQGIANAAPLPSHIFSVIHDEEAKGSEGQNPRLGRSYWRIVSIAAAIVLICTAGWFFIRKETSPETLFISYFEPYPNVAAPIVRNGAVKKPLEQALLVYEQQNYVAAIDQLLAIAQKKPTEVVSFYLAMSYLSNGNAPEAIKRFQALKDQVSASYQKQTLWYLALAFLADKQVDKCKSVLKQLMKEDNFYQKKATKLFKQL
ncbi:hypothetical protein [Microscilla marina]|uniref:Tetratricopeptide repeat domain protein n=1 Tax=Microscilla marina ATCC 23134 TaxID=313606 RepID=A1ZYU7_MICM2|nr:hypothetical protein [Microscilla marina]EAY24444.1 hypothetical protein M23134_06298 [Microscilla marina ATCC 23134]